MDRSRRKVTMSRRRNPLTAPRWIGWVVCFAGVLGLSVLAGVLFGAGKVSVAQLLPGGAELSEVQRTILFEVRVPRVLLAALLGGALTVAGVVFQALLRNPLADPYVLGVSGGASIGGVLALVLGASHLLGGVAVPLFAFGGALGALMLIKWIATVHGRLTVYDILLTGAIFNAFSAALIYFIQSIASLQQLHEIVFYLMGRIPAFDYQTLLLLASFIFVTVVLLFSMSRDYNMLTLGEEGALQLGVNIERTKLFTFILGSLLTGLAVSVSGLIGFVGLVVPHILRLILGPDHRLLLPAAFLGGAAFLVLADLLARLLLAPNELPVGVVTALIGGPFFLFLLRRRSRNFG
jgi:iron complex transport system permease protein